MKFKASWRVALWLLLLIGEISYADSLSVLSWNVKHLGRKGLDTERVASILKPAAIITLQEVNTSPSGKAALTDVAKALQKLIGERVCTGLSEIPTGSKERYAYLWRNSQISYVKVDGTIMESCPESAITIRLGVKNADKIIREPAYGTFYWKANKAHFVLASIHLVPSGKKPQAEVGPLFDTFRGVPGAIIVTGDFNLDSTHPSFKGATELGFVPAMKGVKTSMKMKKREMSKAYDNFWYKGFEIQSTKVTKLFEAFPELDQKIIYKNLSDHCPILAEFSLSDRPSISDTRE